MATTPNNYRRLEGSELRPPPGARPLGPASETETLRVTIMLRSCRPRCRLSCHPLVPLVGKEEGAPLRMNG
jgi:hypothetical protein